MDDKVKIGCYMYKIENKPLLSNSIDVKGMCDFLNLTIKIDETLNKELKKETLIHECVHALDNFMDIDLTEEQVVKLGKSITMFIIDNKELINKIYDKDI